MEAPVLEVDHRLIVEPAKQEGDQHHHLQHACGEHAPGHGLDAALAGEGHHGHDHSNAQREAGQLRRHELLHGVEQAGDDDAGHVEGQAQHHDAGELHRQRDALGVEAVNQIDDRLGEGVHHRRDDQRRKDEQVQRVAGEVVGVAQAVLLPLLHEQRHDGRRDAGVEQQHREVEQGVGRGVRVVLHAGSEVTGGDHVAHQAEHLAEYDDHRDQRGGADELILACQDTDLHDISYCTV